MMKNIYVIYLLAHFREPRAYPAIVAVVSRPGELPFDLLQKRPQVPWFSGTDHAIVRITHSGA